mmetsp:Transcript_46781/g.105807  ORF Transcript_46781/g.105807 Transcript_46781/m.105807 type:complete len:603 (+) Transcript_46781:223-2031(+)
MEYAQLHKQGIFWGATFKDLEIAGGSIGAPASGYGAAGSTIVDSGTTYTYIPTALAAAFKSRWLALTGFEYREMETIPNGVDRLSLPDLVFVLERDGGGDLRVTVGPSSYLDDWYGEYYMSICFEGSTKILGANVMKDHDVYFDWTGMRMGWAPAECEWTGADQTNPPPSPAPARVSAAPTAAKTPAPACTSAPTSAPASTPAPTQLEASPPPTFHHIPSPTWAQVLVPTPTPTAGTAPTPGPTSQPAVPSAPSVPPVPMPTSSDSTLVAGGFMVFALSWPTSADEAAIRAALVEALEIEPPSSKLKAFEITLPTDATPRAAPSRQLSVAWGVAFQVALSPAALGLPTPDAVASHVSTLLTGDVFESALVDHMSREGSAGSVLFDKDSIAVTVAATVFKPAPTPSPPSRPKLTHRPSHVPTAVAERAPQDDTSDPLSSGVISAYLGLALAGAIFILVSVYLICAWPCSRRWWKACVLKRLVDDPNLVDEDDEETWRRAANRMGGEDGDDKPSKGQTSSGGPKASKASSNPLSMLGRRGGQPFNKLDGDDHEDGEEGIEMAPPRAAGEWEEVAISGVGLAHEDELPAAEGDAPLRGPKDAHLV